MTGRKWTEEEIDILKKRWGKSKIKNISKKINRTEIAIKIKAKRLGLGGLKKYFSQREVYMMLSISQKTLKKYREKNIINFTRASTEATIYSCKLEDLIKFMEQHQDLWDSRKLLYEPWFERPQWFIDKLAKDRCKPPKGNGCRYTKDDDRKIIDMYRSGKSNEEIAKELGRNSNGIAHRLCRINYGIEK